MKLVNKFYRRWNWIYNRLFDYYYLKSELQRSRETKPDTLIAGSSYAIFGIENYGDKCCNFGLPSQDIYYSLKILINILNNSEGVKRIILGVGMYSLCSDLSRTKNLDESRRIVDVYYPLLADSNHLSLTEIERIKMKDDVLTRLIIHAQKIFLFTNKNTHNMKYFMKNHTREKRKICTWNDLKKKWSELSSEEKVIAAQLREESHERQIKHSMTFKENMEALYSFKQFCENKKIEMYVFVAPMSSAYLSMMSDEYMQVSIKQDEFFRNLDDSNHYIDFNDVALFSDDCFVDPDHLNDQGAELLTCYLKNFITINEPFTENNIPE